MKFVAALIVTTVAAVDNASNGIGGNAPCMTSQVAINGEENSQIGDDPHGVYGIEASDKGIVITGFSVETGSSYDGFVIKTRGSCDYTGYHYLVQDGSDCDDYSFEWSTKIVAANDGKMQKAIWVAESSDETYYIVVGLAESTTNEEQTDAYIGKLDTDGTIIWEMRTASTTAGYSSAFETVAFTSDGGFVVGGVFNSEAGMEDLLFKSSGIIEDGTPYMAKITAADAAASSAPSGFDWTYSGSVEGSTRSLRVDSSDNIYAISGATCNLVKLASDGSLTWDSGDTLNANGQMNDLEVVSDGVVIVGHIYGTADNTKFSSITGHMVKTDLLGVQQWTQDYGNYPGGLHQFAGLEAGNNALIYTECFGVAPTYASDLTTQTGFAVSCGSGIEGCDGLWRKSPSTWWECRRDPRTTWRALTISTDLDGERVWSRQDSWWSEGVVDVGSTGGEFVINLSSGGTAIVTDVDIGLGVERIALYDDVACTTEFDQAFTLTTTMFAAIACIMVHL